MGTNQKDYHICDQMDLGYSHNFTYNFMDCKGNNWNKSDICLKIIFNYSIYPDYRGISC